MNGGNTVSTNVSDFDTSGNGASFAGAFNVGSSRVGIDGGVSVSQTFEVMTSGLFNFSADVAAANGDFSLPNVAAGMFELVVNGMVLDTIDFEFIDRSEQERGTLLGSTFLTAGTNTFAIQITRDFLSSATTPTQYIDNASVTPVPLPAGMPLMLAGLGALAFMRRRKTTA